MIKLLIGADNPKQKTADMMGKWGKNMDIQGWKLQTVKEI